MRKSRGIVCIQCGTFVKSKNAVLSRQCCLECAALEQRKALRSATPWWPDYSDDTFDGQREEEPERKLTLREKRRLFRDWKTQKQGSAGIPSSYLWKRLGDMTLAEAVSFHNDITSGRSWGDIQFDGLSGDMGRMRDHEYDDVFGYKRGEPIWWIER